MSILLSVSLEYELMVYTATADHPSSSDIRLPPFAFKQIRRLDSGCITEARKMDLNSTRMAG